MSVTAQNIDDVLNGKTTLAGALGLSAGVVEVFAVLGSQCYEQGRYQDARTMFQAAITLDHSCYLGHAGLGAVCLVEDDLDGALSSLQRAYELNAKDPAVCGNLGEACLRQARQAEAIRYLREAAALDATHTNPFANRARGMLLAIPGQATSADSRR
jgi:tetratricopeptide (TPR) repeat protein